MGRYVVKICLIFQRGFLEVSWRASEKLHYAFIRVLLSKIEHWEELLEASWRAFIRGLLVQNSLIMEL